MASFSFGHCCLLVSTSAICMISAMRILISNDDGIYAPGIAALYEAVKDLGEIHVVAPSGEQSAVGHAITLSDPIKTQKIFKNGDFLRLRGGRNARRLRQTGRLRPARQAARSRHQRDKPRPECRHQRHLLRHGFGGHGRHHSRHPQHGRSPMNTFKDPNWETAARVARHLAQVIHEKGLAREHAAQRERPESPLGRTSKAMPSPAWANRDSSRPSTAARTRAAMCITGWTANWSNSAT